MVSSGRGDGLGEGGRRDDASDRFNRPPLLDGDYPEVPMGSDDPTSDRPRLSAGGSSSVIGGDGFADRLRDVLRGESDGGAGQDGEEGLLHWLRALDLQVLGACRGDERLKPLLKLDVSSGAAEDRLLSQLNQHFEVSDIGLLARYLCVPLVSIRVGKVTKEGSLLCPTSVSGSSPHAGKVGVFDVLLRSLIYERRRGQLSLNLLPSSNLRLSFIGDDGHTERLALVTNDLDVCNIEIEEISADISGRTFLLKLPGSWILYYWCSEKSILHGRGLLAKMKDLLRSRPTLSCLTGISRSRLDSFATHLKAYLVELSNIAEASLSASTNGSVINAHTHDSDSQTSCMPPNQSCLHLAAAFTGTGQSLCQGLTPVLNIYQDEKPRTLSATGEGRFEKLKQHSDCNLISLAIGTNLTTSTSVGVTSTVCASLDAETVLADIASPTALQCSLPEIPFLPSSFVFNPIPVHLPPFQLNVPTSRFSPYYCWCPPCPPSMQFAVTPSCLQPVSSETLSLPALSTLLSATGPTVPSVPSKLPIDISLQAVIPDPLFPVALPVSSLNLTGSQRFPTYVPLMADPIVHIPVIDVCSSGQGYLVSAGPTMSSAIPPLLPGFANPLITKVESAAEKSARETLQMLLASGPLPFSSHKMNVLPVVFNSAEINHSFGNVSENATVALDNGVLFDFGDVEMTDASADDLSFTLYEPWMVVDQVKSEPNDNGRDDDPQ